LQDIQSVIIEGGAYTLDAFIEAGVWDEARVFTGTATLTKGIEAPKINGIIAEEIPSGADHLQIIYNK
jgi:diaminohydroxyphosphoribosylaminopyrimidine deaminase/5-amino-6-(5-phosphoribosylamino)uracil reductase